MAIQRIVSIYKDLLSGIQGIVQCIATADTYIHYNKLYWTIFISVYWLFYLN